MKLTSKCMSRFFFEDLMVDEADFRTEFEISRFRVTQRYQYVVRFVPAGGTLNTKLPVSLSLSPDV